MAICHELIESASGHYSLGYVRNSQFNDKFQFIQVKFRDRFKAKEKKETRRVHPQLVKCSLNLYLSFGSANFWINLATRLG